MHNDFLKPLKSVVIGAGCLILVAGMFVGGFLMWKFQGCAGG